MKFKGTDSETIANLIIQLMELNAIAPIKKPSDAHASCVGLHFGEPGQTFQSIAQAFKRHRNLCPYSVRCIPVPYPNPTFKKYIF